MRVRPSTRSISLWSSNHLTELEEFNCTADIEEGRLAARQKFAGFVVAGSNSTGLNRLP